MSDSATKLPRRVYLGLQVEAAANGVNVTSVAPESSAARAGLTVGDHIVALNGEPTDDVPALSARARTLSLGDSVSFDIERNGVRHVLADRARPLPTEDVAPGRVVLDEVSVDGRAQRAIWTLPDSPSPHPAVYVLPGASWSSCEFPHASGHPLLELVRGLTRAGFATLRVERSGMGDSAGPSCTELDFEAELAGYRAGFAHLIASPAVDRSRLFVFGESLGGMIAPLLVGRTDSVLGIIVFGSSAKTWHDCLLGSSRRHAELMGFSGDALEKRMSGLTELQELVYVRQKTPHEALTARPDLASAALGWADGGRVFGRVAAFFHQLQRAEIRAAWEATRIPVLALHAEHDWLCTGGDAREIIELVGARAGSSMVELPNVDHHMRDCGALADSLEPGTGRFAQRVLDSTLAWLQRCVGSQASGNTQP